VLLLFCSHRLSAKGIAMAKFNKGELLQSLGRFLSGMIAEQVGKPPFTLAIIARNGSGLIMDNMFFPDREMHESSALVAGNQNKFVTPIRIIFFDSEGKSGSCMIDNDFEVIGVSALKGHPVGEHNKPKHLETVGNFIASTLKFDGYKSPFRIALITSNIRGIIIDDLINTDGHFSGTLNSAVDEEGIGDEGWTIFFDSEGRSGFKNIGDEEDANGAFKGFGDDDWDDMSEEPEPPAMRLAGMPFHTQEEALGFDIKFAIHSFKYAPPRKKDTAAMCQWKDWLAKHVMEHLQRSQWEFKRKEQSEIGPSAPHMPLRED
jgi:hypothetical protein